MTVNKDEELENDEEEDEDEDDDGDEDEDEEPGDEDEDDDGELTPEKVAQQVTECLRDGYDRQVSVNEHKAKIFLDLDDDSRWLLIIKRRD